MESNWRFNVWDLGITSTTVELIARLREPNDFVGGVVTGAYISKMPESPNAGVVWFLYQGSSFLNAGGIVLAPNPKPNFPFGWDVLED